MIGKLLKLMKPQLLYGTRHAVTPLLQQYSENGCPVDYGPNWLRGQIEALLVHGPHLSTLGRKEIQQIQLETIEKISQGYARVVKWGNIKRDILPQLKISPVAMIPHKSKEY